MLESKKHYTHKDHKPHNKNYTKIITENHYKSEKPTFLKLKQNKRIMPYLYFKIREILLILCSCLLKLDFILHYLGKRNKCVNHCIKQNKRVLWLYRSKEKKIKHAYIQHTEKKQYKKQIISSTNKQEADVQGCHREKG